MGNSNRGKTKGRKQSPEEIEKRVSHFRGSNSHFWRGGITKDINEYQRIRYKNLPEDKKKHYRWLKNKRNRVIKRLKIESLSHTWEQWVLLKIKYNLTCPCCKKSEPEITLTEDHIIPLSKGGNDSIENIQPLCLSCNVKKYNKLIKY